VQKFTDNTGKLRAICGENTEQYTTTQTKICHKDNADKIDNTDNAGNKMQYKQYITHNRYPEDYF
jgi:hypothetical protein